MKMRLFLIAAVCMMVLSACNKPQLPDSSDEIPAQSAGSASSVVDPEPESAPLTKTEAQALLAEDIDTGTYMILDTATKVTVDGEEYYVFIVANNADAKVAGQIAVSTKTGEKFTYKGEYKGKEQLSAYTEFALYDPNADRTISWEGIFTTDDGSRTLELLPMDDNSFEYMLDDTSGIAQVKGNTATDTENGITFTYGDDNSIELKDGTAQFIFQPAAAA